jgi:alpha-tubulin suppressor-like RCC1 family protein
LTSAPFAAGRSAPRAVTSAIAPDSLWPTARVGQTLAHPPRVRVRSATGLPVPGVPVRFAVARGGGALIGAESLTDSLGEASVSSWTLGAAPGTNALTARADTLPPLTALATALPAALRFSVVSVGLGESCGLNDDQRLYCWGSGDLLRTLDRVAGADTWERPVPTRTAGDLTFRQLATGLSMSCGLTPAGQAVCWGSGSNQVPTPLQGAPAFTSLAGGHHHACGVTADQRAYCWGSNRGGQLGSGTRLNADTPTQVAGGLAFTEVSAGIDHSCGITPQGALYCWGANASGQLGDGTTEDRLAPTRVLGTLTVTRVAAGGRHTCALSTSGRAYCWGVNESGELGDGTATRRAVPTTVATAEQFTGLWATVGRTCATTAGGAAHCWGNNEDGRLGDGTTTQRSVPTRVGANLTFRSLSLGLDNTCGVTPDGAAYCWGPGNVYGDLGIGRRDFCAHYTPEHVFGSGDPLPPPRAATVVCSDGTAPSSAAAKPRHAGL